MAEPSSTEGPPRRILLATDLSARCDRALDRAASLARAWRAELVALHVLEQTDEFYAENLERRVPSWRRPDELARVVEEQLRADMSEAAENVAAIVELGDPAEVVLKVARERDCGLIVAGLARDETLGRFGLGSLVHKLLRRSRTPLLVVKKRVRSPYRHVVVATDFSESSRHALRTAMRFFPDPKLSILHAYDPVYADVTAADPRDDETRRSAALAEAATFLAAAGMPEERQRGVGLLVEHGDPAGLIRDYARNREVDLVALGAQGRSALLDIFLGSTARDILSALPCDALLVREPSASAEGELRP